MHYGGMLLDCWYSQLNMVWLGIDTLERRVPLARWKLKERVDIHIHTVSHYDHVLCLKEWFSSNKGVYWLILSQSLFQYDIISYYKCGLYKYRSEEAFLTCDRCCSWDSQISWQAMGLFLIQRNLVDEPNDNITKMHRCRNIQEGNKCIIQTFRWRSGRSGSEWRILSAVDDRRLHFSSETKQ